MNCAVSINTHIIWIYSKTQLNQISSWLYYGFWNVSQTCIIHIWLTVHVCICVLKPISLYIVSSITIIVTISPDTIFSMFPEPVASLFIMSVYKHRNLVVTQNLYYYYYSLLFLTNFFIISPPSISRFWHKVTCRKLILWKNTLDYELKSIVCFKT